MKQPQTLINAQVFRGGYTYGEMEPGIKNESEERVTCADGSLSAAEDLGSNSSQPSDQQSETLNLTKVFQFTLQFNYHSSFVQRLISKDHSQCELCQQMSGGTPPTQRVLPSLLSSLVTR